MDRQTDRQTYGLTETDRNQADIYSVFMPQLRQQKQKKWYSRSEDKYINGSQRNPSENGTLLPLPAALALLPGLSLFGAGDEAGANGLVHEAPQP